MDSAAEISLSPKRASLLIAEALVERHDPATICERAHTMGLPHGLTSAVVAACCDKTIVPATQRYMSPAVDHGSGPKQ
jgi:hypothetical protein